MQPFKQLVSRTVVLRERNIDTDQIIPARFLTTTERKGLGRHAFNDWRSLPDGAPNPEFPFNRAENAGAQILVAGRNFGCGSSREHAPWALLDLGLRAVEAGEYAIDDDAAPALPQLHAPDRETLSSRIAWLALMLLNIPLPWRRRDAGNAAVRDA